MSKPVAQHGLMRGVATDVVRRLREAGHESWFVGGCVREMLLGHEPADYDVTTEALPEQVEELFEHVVEVGRRFGVMTVIERGVHVEVATFRTEGSYTDGRRPDHVRFASAAEDVARRDFTINGLLHDPLTQEVVDHVGGRADLEQGIVRTVGDPGQRFREDQLRLLRAVRFAARFGFRLEAATEQAIRELAPKVVVVSPERIHDELHRMLADPSRSTAVRLLRELGLLAAVLPEVAGVAPFEPVAATVAALPPEVPSLVAWAALFIRAAAQLDALLGRLRFSNVDRRTIEQLVARRAEPRELAAASLARRRRFAADPLWEDLVQLAEGEARGAGEDTSFVEVARSDRVEHGDRLPAPLVGGDDLRAAGLSPGPAYARLLDRLLDEQLEGRLADRAAARSRLEELVARERD